MTRLMTSLVLALLFVATTGCASYSEDRGVYHSTYMSPKTVYVTDVITGDTVWSYDVPPGHVLMIEFDVGRGNLESIRQERGYPTTMEWALYPEQAGRSLIRKNHFRGTAVERGEQPLQGRPIRSGFTVGEPISPEDLAPPTRSIEEIQQDLPEPDAGDAAEDAVEDAADAVEDAADDAADAVDDAVEE